jgi:hypothetical protein
MGRWSRAVTPRITAMPGSVAPGMHRAMAVMGGKAQTQTLCGMDKHAQVDG